MYYIYNRGGKVVGKYSSSTDVLKWYNLLENTQSNNYSRSNDSMTRKELLAVISNIRSSKVPRVALIFHKTIGTTYLSNHPKIKFRRYAIEYEYLMDYSELAPYKDTFNANHYDNRPDTKKIGDMKYIISNCDTTVSPSINYVKKIFYHINPKFSGRINKIYEIKDQGILSLKESKIF